MDVGTALSVVGTLLSAVQCPELKEFLSIFGYESRVDDLKNTVESINAVLCDEEAKQELSLPDQHSIKKLKDAVFEADDLFDEFVTLAEQNKLREADGCLCQKVSDFFSLSKNKLSVACRMSRGVKDIKKKLDAIAYNRQFILKIDSKAIKERSETCPSLNEFEINVRKGDLNVIVDELLACNDESHVSVLSIVGVGGSGKTTLARLAYNDKRVEDSFPLRAWACVSDHDQEVLNVQSILIKILTSITEKNHDKDSMDQLQSQLRKQLEGKKYLLVLDDVWTEKRFHWSRLMSYLNRGEKGSRIVVTTRSQETAEITGGSSHNLSQLSEEESWLLFKEVAFGSDQPNPPDEELVGIGRNIVDECNGVPLAIKVVGSFLYGKNKKVWLATQENGLANKKEYNDDIMPILKFSFYQLTAPLKNCFRYCALFPKDYVIRKELLISIWMAQGYIVPLDNGQSIEDAGEEYFSILSKRCFFQNITRNKIGEIKSCKIHHLMHDLARNVSGKEMCPPGNFEGNVDVNVRHLSISDDNEYERFSSLDKTHIRSLLSFDCPANIEHLVEGLVKRFRYLRVFDLSDKKIKHLPDSINKLLHLRYIDLSKNIEMEVVPNSITTLCNLQTLILNDCSALKELPKDLGRLVKLRVLDIKDCVELRWMPRGMGNLERLHTLKGYYPVGGGERCTSWKQCLDGLEDLKSLINLKVLKGHLKIKIWWPKNAKNDVKEDVREGLYLRSMEHLNKIELCFKDLEEDSGTMEDEERIRRRVMEDLQPHSKLERLSVGEYNGVEMPGWLAATHLPYLVKLRLEDCRELKYLPSVGNFCHLKILCLGKLPKLEYIEEEDESRMLASSSTSAQKASLFPSLEELQLEDLPKFEGWRRVGVGMEESRNTSSSNQIHFQQQCLSHLEGLEISSSNMKPQLQLCLSQLKILKIRGCPDLACNFLCPMLQTLDLSKFNDRLRMICSTKTDERSKALIDEEDLVPVPKLTEVQIDKVAWLKSMPMEAFHTLEILTINGDGDMVKLPDWMQYLSALQTLRIGSCDNLEAMPSWMTKLTSLRHLDLSKCSERLKNRCRENPPGEDWPYIQQIPDINLGFFEEMIACLVLLVFQLLIRSR